MKFTRELGAGLAVAFGLYSSMASASISLTFTGLDGNNEEGVANYYDGGFGSLGSGPGPNYGIIFSSNGIVCNPTPSGSCNTAGLPAGDQTLFFLTGGAATMDVPGGFNNGFSFLYTSPFTTGTFVNVWSGLDDTGTLLATITLPQTPPSSGPSCYGQPFCPYESAGISFAGVGHSADFGGTTDEVGFSDVTLGSATPGGIPETGTWVMMMLGFAGLGLLGYRTSRKNVAFIA